MKRSCKKICVAYSALMVFVSLSASDKNSCASADSSRVTAGIGVLGCVAAAAIVKNVCAKNEQLVQENRDLQRQNVALGITLAVTEQNDDRSQWERERDQLKQENDSLEKQNRILREYCPLLKEAAWQASDDIAQSWSGE